jgi:hypothetical protein
VTPVPLKARHHGYMIMQAPRNPKTVNVSNPPQNLVAKRRSLWPSPSFRLYVVET